MTKDEAPTSPKDAALTLALEALEDAAYEWSGYVEVDTAPRTLLEHLAPRITAIKEALAQPEQEPKTYALLYPQADYVATLDERPWVGLTDEDKQNFAAAQHGWEDLLTAAEAKLKEKNA